MRAAVLTAEHTFDVVEMADPEPGPGELVLQVRACGICGSDLKAYTSMAAGTVMGHEFCGTVVGVGADARSWWREGQLVAGMPLSGCGRCRWCVTGEQAHCATADLQGVGGRNGAFAELVRVDAAGAVALTPGLDERGALVEPLAVGLHTVAAAELRPGERVLVIGGGNIGLAVALWARRLGAGHVVVSEPMAGRRDVADRFGATGVHDPGSDPPPQDYDVVFECTGVAGTIQAAVDAATARGRVVVAGVCMVPDTFVPVIAVLKEVTVRFAVYYRRTEFAAAAALVEDGGIDADLFVTSRVGLDGLDAAFRDLLSTTAERKVLVTP